MTINWSAVATIAAPIIALFVGAWVTRWLESRPVLISFYGHVSSFTHTPPGGQPIYINTHTVVLRNASRRPATNVRVHHATLPDFNIWPQVVHNVQTLPDGSQDIVIPTLVPGEEIIVSYLYLPPVTWNQVNAGIKWDQGFAHQIPVLIQRQYPRWANRTVAMLTLVGLISVAYVVYRALIALLR